jgi:hypothetical protein
VKGQRRAERSSFNDCRTAIARQIPKTSPVQKPFGPPMDPHRSVASPATGPQTRLLVVIAEISFTFYAKSGEVLAQWSSQTNP